VGQAHFQATILVLVAVVASEVLEDLAMGLGVEVDLVWVELEQFQAKSGIASPELVAAVEVFVA